MKTLCESNAQCSVLFTLTFFYKLLQKRNYVQTIQISKTNNCSYQNIGNKSKHTMKSPVKQQMEH